MKKCSKKLPRGMGSGRSIARGIVYQLDGVWHLAVSDSLGKIIVTDNGGDWRNIFDTAFDHVSALRRIENIGHRLIRDYEFLVNRAPVDF